MSFIQRVMRVMTHVNIGATLGLVAWLAWASLEVASGARPIPRHPPVDRSPAGSRPVSLPCCFVPGTPAGPALLEAHEAQVRHIAAAEVRP